MERLRCRLLMRGRHHSLVLHRSSPCCDATCGARVLSNHRVSPRTATDVGDDRQVGRTRPSKSCSTR